MRWNYDPKWRDMFDDGVHRDILIVPHATKVTKVQGQPPLVTSKVPKFYKDNDPEPSHHVDGDVKKEGLRIPGEYEDVEWTIENGDIINEKFEYADGISSNDKLAYGSCEAAMIKFTIRNNKTYNNETHRWELDIPDLQNIQVITDDGKTLLGELQGAAIIEVWTYINGDSSSLQWLGMYKVEQDKATGNGYEREIIAYDFMLTFRDMDIFEWYKALFEGVPMDSEDPSKGKREDMPYDEHGWTIGEALKYLFDQLAYQSPSVPTTTNPKDYLLDMDADKYPGYGMPIILDPDLFDTSVKPLEIPDEYDPTDPQLAERYGWMMVMDLPFIKDEKIIKKGQLSCGKFLEDIAILAGRFGMIRKDIFEDDNYIDPDPTKKHRYNTYEKCYLTFRPIETKDSTIRSENCFDNSDVEKGFQYDNYDTVENKLIQIYDYDNNELVFFCPSGLSEKDKTDFKNGNRADIGSLTILENMFTSYLKKDDTADLGGAFILKLLQKGRNATKNVIDYEESVRTGHKETKSVTYGVVPYLTECYNNIIYRPYRPYQLTSFGDLCRMPGDRIHVEGIDRITGEEYNFDSYIFVRRITGVQKMMDKYTAKGNIIGGTYSDYRAGDLNDSFHPQSLGYGRLGGGSGNSNGGTNNTTISGISQEDLKEILRNAGMRFLDEPTDCEAVYNAEDNTVTLKWSDPEDKTGNKPIPMEWAGTTVVRAETVPLSRWGGVNNTKIVNSSTRDQYKTDGYVDDTVERGKKYYYAFMPYYVQMDDDDLTIRIYTWTKYIEVNTEYILTAPEIKSLALKGEKNPWDGSEIEILWSGTSNKMTAKVANSHVVFTMYSGSTVIYSFNAASGTTASDVANISIGFLQDSDLQLAKPSMVYKDGSTYDYNQEEPTETEMGLIYTWLQAGLPSS